MTEATSADTVPDVTPESTPDVTPDTAQDTAPDPTPDVPDTDMSKTSLSEGPAQMGEDTGGTGEDTQDTAAEVDAQPDPEVTSSAEPVVSQSAPVADAGSVPEAVESPTETPADTMAEAATETPPNADPTPLTAPPAPPAAPEKRGGFFPMLLGGAVAAGLGYGTHYVQTSTAPDTGADTEIAALQAELAQVRALAEQEPDLSALEDRIAALAPADPVAPVDIAPLQAELDALRAQIAALPDMSAMQAEIDALRNAPQVDLTPIEQALSSLDAAYAPVPDQIAALQQDMDALRDLATAEVAAAEAAVDAALASAGLDRIRAALVTGAPFEDAVAQVAQSGADVPAALTEAAGGVQTVEMLQDSYGAAARAAIAASLQSAPAESATEKLGNFFRAQIGARSLAPRDGDDADAVTSRAGAAVADGDLPAALEELAALPEAGRAAMSDWLGAVETRLNAVAALDALQASITTE